jgi:hypothetical protein
MNVLAELNMWFSEAAKLIPFLYKVQEVWKGTYSQVRAVLDGEPDLVEEFELFYLNIQALGRKDAWRLAN